MQVSSTRTLVFVTGLFFFTSNLSGSFLPVYFRHMGLNVPEIVEILLFTFAVIGLLPLVLLKTVRNFERVISIGIFTTMLFFVVLIFVENPIVLGLAHGLSIATFWPSFNLLQFKISESRRRARTVSLFSSIIPSLTSIAGPATGGFIIEKFGFAVLFMASIVLYLAAFLISTRIKFRPEAGRFTIPRNWKFTAFFMTFILLGWTESYWLAYPFFVLQVSGTIMNMGLVLALSAVLISIITFLVNWLSDIKRKRVEFAVTGTTLIVLWYFAIACASTMQEVVALALLSGLGSAFSISWFAHFGDSFGKEYYASILVMMETGLMIGRIVNLIPTQIFVSNADYSSYFILAGIMSLLLIPLYVIIKRDNKVGSVQ